MPSRPLPGGGAATHTPLVLRHLEDLYGAEPAPACSVERVTRPDHWFGVLPRPEDLDPSGLELLAAYRALGPELRARLAALAVQGEMEVLSVERAALAATGFLEIGARRRTHWSTDLHRVAVLAAARPDDHRRAAELTSPGRPLSGAALHLLLADDEVPASDLASAAEFYARADRPSWAVCCLVNAADATTPPEARASLAAAAAGVAAFDGDFRVVERVLERFADADPRTLLGESAPARGLRQALLENDPAAGRATLLARLREPALGSTATSEALAAFALINVVNAEESGWVDYLSFCSTAPVPLHPEVVSIATTIGAPNSPAEPHLDAPLAVDGRGWSQLAGSLAMILNGYRDMRLSSFAPATGLDERVGNRLVRAVEATFVAVTLAHNQHWTELDAALAIALDNTRELIPIPLMRVGSEAMLALAEAFRGDRDAARRRVERILAEPIVRRAHRLRAILDSAVVMIEGPQGDYERAMALLSTRQSDVLNLTVGPCGPMELFDFVDYALMLGEADQAVERVERFRQALQQQHSERADFVLDACDAAIAARKTLEPAERLLDRAGSLPFVYESARLRLVYAEHLRRARRTPEARRHLVRVELDLLSVQAGAWMDRVHRELQACRREVGVGAGELTEQEARIAELAAAGRSNKEIGATLYLSPRTVGGHLYKIFPKLGITTRAQLRDALAAQPGDG